MLLGHLAVHRDNLHRQHVAQGLERPFPVPRFLAIHHPGQGSHDALFAVLDALEHRPQECRRALQALQGLRRFGFGDGHGWGGLPQEGAQVVTEFQRPALLNAKGQSADL